jgi:sigma-E factor negative regulatory protein RseC
MATETGVVTKISYRDARTAWVKTVPSSACESCSSRHQCSTKSGSQEREVEAINEVGAKAGDRIQLAINTGSLLKATFLLYIFPVLCMLVGGIAGHAIALRFQWDTSLFAALAAMACLAVAMLVVRFGGNRMANKAAYRPRIIRIINRASDANASIAFGQDQPVISTE